MNGEQVLDVGCGGSKVSGAVGIDRFELTGVDVVHDLNILPWPFEAESFDNIIFSHSISHLNDICKIMLECHRLLKPGGLIEIVAPHFSSDNFHTDPTHTFSMGYRSMYYFVRNVEFGYTYMDESKLFELVNNTLSFREASTSWRDKPKFNFAKIIGIEFFANKFPRLYERHFVSLFPVSEVYFLLKKAK